MTVFAGKPFGQGLRDTDRSGVTALDPQRVVTVRGRAVGRYQFRNELGEGPGVARFRRGFVTVVLRTDVGGNEHLQARKEFISEHLVGEDADADDLYLLRAEQCILRVDDRRIRIRVGLRVEREGYDVPDFDTQRRRGFPADEGFGPRTDHAALVDDRPILLYVPAIARYANLEEILDQWISAAIVDGTGEERVARDARDARHRADDSFRSVGVQAGVDDEFGDVGSSEIVRIGALGAVGDFETRQSCAQADRQHQRDGSEGGDIAAHALSDQRPQNLHPSTVSTAAGAVQGADR